MNAPSLRDLGLVTRVLLAAPFAVLTWACEALATATYRVTRAILRGDLR